MRLVGFLLSLLGILIVMVANLNVSVQIINALVSLLTSVSQIALQYLTSQALTIGGLVGVVIGLLLILLSYRR